MMFKLRREKFMWLAVPQERLKMDCPAEMGVCRRTVDPVKHNFQEACR